MQLAHTILDDFFIVFQFSLKSARILKLIATGIEWGEGMVHVALMT